MLLRAVSSLAASVAACCCAAITPLKLALSRVRTSLSCKERAARSPRRSPWDTNRPRRAWLRSKGANAAYELHVDAAINRVTARHHAEGVGDRHRHADKLSETVVRHAERKQSPQREAEQAERGRQPRKSAPDGGQFRRWRSATLRAWRRDEVESNRRDHELSRSGVRQHEARRRRDRGGDFAAGDRNGRKQHTGTTSSSRPSTKPM